MNGGITADMALGACNLCRSRWTNETLDFRPIRFNYGATVSMTTPSHIFFHTNKPWTYTLLDGAVVLSTVSHSYLFEPYRRSRKEKESPGLI